MTTWPTDPRSPLWTPEYGPRGVEVGAMEFFGDNPERIDALALIERLRAKLIEGGLELDDDHRGLLFDELHRLLGLLEIDSERVEDIDRTLSSLRETLNDRVADPVEEIIDQLELGEEEIALLRPALEKIALLRDAHGDGWIYRELARSYHPDVTAYDPEEAQEIFKLVNGRLWDKERGMFVFN